jgi:hypothetical protein
VESPWWKSNERHSNVSSKITNKILSFIKKNGPVTSRLLPDLGKTGNKKNSALALELLWTKCQIVSFRNNSREKLYTVPERFLSPDMWNQISSILVPKTETSDSEDEEVEQSDSEEEEEEEEEKPTKKVKNSTSKKLKIEEELNEEGFTPFLIISKAIQRATNLSNGLS